MDEALEPTWAVPQRDDAHGGNGLGIVAELANHQDPAPTALKRQLADLPLGKVGGHGANPRGEAVHGIPGAVPSHVGEGGQGDEIVAPVERDAERGSQQHRPDPVPPELG